MIISMIMALGKSGCGYDFDKTSTRTRSWGSFGMRLREYEGKCQIRHPSSNQWKPAPLLLRNTHICVQTIDHVVGSLAWYRNVLIWAWFDRSQLVVWLAQICCENLGWCWVGIGHSYLCFVIYILFASNAVHVSSPYASSSCRVISKSYTEKVGLIGDSKRGRASSGVWLRVLVARLLDNWWPMSIENLHFALATLPSYSQLPC